MIWVWFATLKSGWRGQYWLFTLCHAI